MINNVGLNPSLVKSKKDFEQFIADLFHDFKENEDSWENNSLGLYLEGMSGWFGDIDGYYLNKEEDTPAQPSWEMLATLLLAAKVYE